MRRHGFSAAGLREAGELRPAIPRRGGRVHLPLAGLPRGRGAAADDRRGRRRAAHQGDLRLAPDRGRGGQPAASYPDFFFRPRIGTELWLGDPDALRVRATVLDTHPVERGDGTATAAGVAPPGHHRGGLRRTSHGIGLESPPAASLRTGRPPGARGSGRGRVVRSPYLVDGKHRLFAEPPHMQASMLFLPHGSRVPQIGEEVAVRVRHTATAFDEVLPSEPPSCQRQASVMATLMSSSRGSNASANFASGTRRVTSRCSQSRSAFASASAACW